MNNISDARPGAAFIQQGAATLSPQSETFSHTHPDHSNPPRNATPQALPQKLLSGSNGHGPSLPQASSTPPPRRPKNAFDLYCNETRSILMVQHRTQLAAGTYDIERSLAEGWQGLSSQEKEAVQQRFEQGKKTDSDKETKRQPGADAEHGTPTPIPEPTKQVEDEDVEMGEDGQSPSGTGEAEGSVAVGSRE